MTGRYMIRLGTQSNVIYWDTPWGVPLSETFISTHFKNAGYTTAMFGKWHLGMFREAYTPMHRGFDEHMGEPVSAQHRPRAPRTARHRNIHAAAQ
eukprot:1434521-Prymnesium_polylepis.1